MDNLINYKKILKYLPQKYSEALKKVPSSTAKNINEIRMRTNRPLSVSSLGKSFFVTENGSLTLHSSLGIVCDRNDINESFKAVCDYSIHSFEKEIAQGYITIEGGNRVGICGTAVGNGSVIETVKYINGLNFRISGQAKGCGEEIFRRLYDKGPVGVIIAGIPLSGKTTVLKDLCRILGEKYRISIIDERSEIAGVYHGEPQNNIGMFSDVLDGYDKKNGIETAVRVLSPEIVVCDEIGGRSDCRAILNTVNSGVKFLASIHGKSLEEAMSREYTKKLVDHGIFDYGVLLGNSDTPGKIVEIKKLRR